MTVHSKFENESIVKELRSRTIELNKGIIKDNSPYDLRSKESAKYLDSEKKICINKFIENINGTHFNIYCNEKLEDLEKIKHYTYVFLLDNRNINENEISLNENDSIKDLIIYIGESKKRGESITINNLFNSSSRIFEHLNVYNFDSNYLRTYIKINSSERNINNIYLKIFKEKYNDNCINEFNEFINYFRYFPRNTYGSIVDCCYFIDEEKENILNDLIKKYETGIGIYNYIKKNKHKFKVDWNYKNKCTINKMLNRIYNSINNLDYEIINFK